MKLLRLLLLLALAGSAHAADWPQFLGPARNGISTETNLAATWPKDGPPVVWQRKTGTGWSGAVTAAGKVILFHRVGDEEIVECLNATNGVTLWKFPHPTRYQDGHGFDNGPRATPVIAGGKVYTFGAEGALHCLELATGKKIWNVDTKKDFGTDHGYFGMACSPLVEGGVVILNLGGSGGAGIVGFDQKTGQVRWKATEEGASYSSPVAATFGGKRRVLVFARDGLVALAPADGKVLWEFPWKPAIRASVSAAVPLVVDDRIFISASYGAGAALLRYAEPEPEKIWSGDDVLSNHYATSVPHEGLLYGFHGRQEQGCHLRCVEWKTGKVRWSEDGFGAGTLLVAGGHLLLLTEKGELLLADAAPEKFTVRARAQILPFESRSHTALADGRLFARGKGQLVCVDLRAAKN